MRFGGLQVPSSRIGFVRDMCLLAVICSGTLKQIKSKLKKNKKKTKKKTSKFVL